MNDIGNIDGYRPTRPVEPSSAPVTRSGSAKANPLPAVSAEGAVSAEDRVELSELGRLLASARDLPDIRMERVLTVRKQIEDGTYETRDKIEHTVNRLMEELS